jgi:hypothetical protein
MSVKTMEAAFFAANEARLKAERALELKRSRLWRAAENEIDVSLLDEREAMMALKAAEYHAQAAWDDAKVEASRVKPHELGPVGTIVSEWVRSSYSFGSNPLRLTGREGRLEIWTPASDRPTNTRWGLPSVGSYYVRVLKKDGTDSRLFSDLRSYGQTWLPKGKVPGVK